MRFTGARHRQGSAVVVESIIGFILNRATLAWLVLHVSGDAAALNHEVWNNAVEGGIDKIAVIDVGEEVLAAVGRILHIQFDRDIAHRGFYQYGWIFGSRFVHWVVTFDVGIKYQG